MSKEIKINVPLDPDTRAALEMSAAENGRAMGREAARFVKEGLAPFLRGVKAANAAKAGRRGA